MLERVGLARAHEPGRRGGADTLDGRPVEDLRARRNGLVASLHLHPATGRLEGPSCAAA